MDVIHPAKSHIGIKTSVYTSFIDTWRCQLDVSPDSGPASTGAMT